MLNRNSAEGKRYQVAALNCLDAEGLQQIFLGRTSYRVTIPRQHLVFRQINQSNRLSARLKKKVDSRLPDNT